MENDGNYGPRPPACAGLRTFLSDCIGYVLSAREELDTEWIRKRGELQRLAESARLALLDRMEGVAELTLKLQVRRFAKFLIHGKGCLLHEFYGESANNAQSR